MNFTPEEIKEGDELIAKMKSCMFSDGYYDATQCAIIAQKMKVEVYDNLYIFFARTDASVNDYNKAKRVLQYLESL